MPVKAPGPLLKSGHRSGRESKKNSQFFALVSLEITGVFTSKKILPPFSQKKKFLLSPTPVLPCRWRHAFCPLIHLKDAERSPGSPLHTPEPGTQAIDNCWQYWLARSRYVAGRF